MPLYTEPYDTADYLDSDEMIAAYLTEELNNNEPFYMAKAVETVARAKGGIEKLSSVTGLTEEELNRAADKKHPDIGAILKVMASFGVRPTASIAA
jgi:probable addiction module antidote protein